MDLAQVLLLAGKPEEAFPAIEEALALFTLKGNLVAAGDARGLIEQLGHPEETAPIRTRSRPT